MNLPTYSSAMHMQPLNYATWQSPFDAESYLHDAKSSHPNPGVLLPNPPFSTRLPTESSGIAFVNSMLAEAKPIKIGILWTDLIAMVMMMGYFRCVPPLDVATNDIFNSANCTPGICAKAPSKAGEV
ncbi:hypothetical protein MA16_Dca018023 [Dendrobium catenatum]|uniref:Uncharacterized protein n=1 Tax=Dendrobium catenatum TaxID=906689 RepID=A0A2I0WPF9_9ASPA|nr:hypothetical protein MA16_Dca018023 [Dendrobium catenatum]